jgi:hypothetical protein
MKFAIRIYLLIVLCGLCTNLVFAQKFDSFVGVRFGGVLPMGELASHEYGYGGYALLGKSFGGEAAWFISPNIGFGVDACINSFEFASGYYAQDVYEANIKDYNKVTYISGPYRVKTFMGGAYYKLAFSPKFHTSFKLMGGLYIARSPDQMYRIEAKFLNLNSYGWKNGATDKNLSFLVGASFEYKLYKEVSLLVQTDFSYTRASYTFITSSTTGYTDLLRMPILRVQPGVNIHF